MNSPFIGERFHLQSSFISGLFKAVMYDDQRVHVVVDGKLSEVRYMFGCPTAAVTTRVGSAGVPQGSPMYVSRYP